MKIYITTYNQNKFSDEQIESLRKIGEVIFLEEFF